MELQKLENAKIVKHYMKIWEMSNLMELQPELCKLIKLERLTIKISSSLVSFPDMGLLHNCLQELHISECSSLRELSLPIAGLPATLKTLYISSCSCLEFPQMEHNHHRCSIEDMSVDNCDLLKMFSMSFFPKLRYLKIAECVNFETLSISDNEELQNLTSLDIKDCPKLVSFPHGLLAAPNLTSFWVWDCNNLKSLPQQMHALLPSLHILCIDNCPEVESFPDGGLPSNLTTLVINNCEKVMKSRMGWDLQTLPSLKEFRIYSDRNEEQVWESFPEEWLLPTTLSSLDISSLRNLKSLNNKGLQHLPSLKNLYISNCPKLQSLPEEGLPNSLSYLEIYGCPLLKPRCQRDKGEDWPKISQIPHINSDHEEDIINLE